jgi:voltage-gated sodium channel
VNGIRNIYRASIFFAICVVAVVIVLQLEADEGDDSLLSSLAYVELVVLIAFCIEAALGIVAECFQPWAYFHQAWNCFDFAVILVSFVPSDVGGNAVMLRMFRLLRVVKMMRSIEALNVVVSGLMDGIASCPAIGAILFLIYYLFAVVGVTLFRENDPWYFGSLHQSMLSLFQVSTMDSWIDLMYINMYGCDRYGYGTVGWPREDMCVDARGLGVVAVVFFVVFTIVSGLVLLSLFLGVVTMSMEAESEKFHAHKQRVDAVAELVHKKVK